jgi:hypothetical protein
LAAESTCVLPHTIRVLGDAFIHTLWQMNVV